MNDELGSLLPPQEDASDPDEKAQATDVDAEEAAVRPSRRRGRPPVDVFRKLGRRSILPTHAWRQIFLKRFVRWSESFPDRIDWEKRRDWGDPDWELRRTAQFAMVVSGRRNPFKLDKKPFYEKDLVPLDKQAMGFAHWLRDELAVNRRPAPGRKPNFLTLWRTALALVVARNVVGRNGRHYAKPPSPREIAQIWYVLFNEEARYDVIRDRLAEVARLCRTFVRDKESAGPASGGEHEDYRKAAHSILGNCPPKPRAKRRRASRKPSSSPQTP